MEEYIKREDAIKHLRGVCIAKYPLSFSYGIFASADEIGKLPAADVAPKSEVAKNVLLELKKQIHDHAVYTNSQDIPNYVNLKVFDAILNNQIKRYTEDKGGIAYV